MDSWIPITGSIGIVCSSYNCWGLQVKGMRMILGLATDITILAKVRNEYIVGSLVG